MIIRVHGGRLRKRFDDCAKEQDKNLVTIQNPIRKIAI